MNAEQQKALQSSPLRVGAKVSDRFTLVAPTWRHAKNGNPYLRASVQLGPHSVPVLAWPSECPGCEAAYETRFVHLMATVDEFRGRYQLRCSRLAPAIGPSATRDWIVSRLVIMTRWIEPPVLRDFVERVFADGKFRKRFLKYPASARHHHAWPSGLVFHSTEVAWGVFESLSHNPDDQGIATVAALFHDAGKTVTLSSSGKLTNAGSAVSHDALTLEVLAEHLAWLDHQWSDGAVKLRALLTGDQRNDSIQELRSLIQSLDRKSACLR